MPDSFMPPNGAPSYERIPVFTATTPHSSASPTRQTRPASRVKKYAASPYSVLFASSIASASVSKRNTGASGPNVSSRATRISGAVLERVRDVLLHLRDRRLIDQRPLLDALVEPAADVQVADGGREILEERFVDPRLHEDAVGAHARLAGLPELRCER